MKSLNQNKIWDIYKTVLKNLVLLTTNTISYYSFNDYVLDILKKEINKFNIQQNDIKNNILEQLAKNITKYVVIPDSHLTLVEKKNIYAKNKKIFILSGYILLLDIYIQNFYYLGIEEEIIKHPMTFLKLDLLKLNFRFSNLIKRLTKDKYYDKKFFSSFLNSDITQQKLDIIFQESHKYYCDYEYSSILLFRLRYLISIRQNLTIDNPFSVFLAISIANLNNNFEQHVVTLFHYLTKRLISLSTPILLNLRSGGSLSSCFIIKTNDSIEEIYDNISKIAKITKNAGGIGINISRIRSYGSSIGKKQNPAVGILPFIRVMNDTILAVNQSGARNGAMTVALDVWHKDLLNFLDIDTEKGDVRLKSFDIFTQVVFNQVFIERVENRQSWTLFDPNEIWIKYKIRLDDLVNEQFREIYLKLEQDKSLSKITLPAMEIIKIILKRWVEKGTPYITMKDKINKLNPNQHSGIIYNGNLCQESFSNFSATEIKGNEIGENIVKKYGCGHTCNLLSINLASFAQYFGKLDTKQNIQSLKNIIKISVLFLDNTISKTKYTIPESYFHNQNYRTIGIGILGLADYLAYSEIKYSLSGNTVTHITSIIAYYSILYSSMLSKVRGPYKYFKNSQWDKGIFFGKTIEQLNNINSNLDWDFLYKKVKQFGLRNGQLLAIAPNTSTSIIQGSSASVLPLFSPNFVDKNAKGIFYMFGKFFDTKLEYYEYNIFLNQMMVIDILSRIQEFIDQGISSELCLNINVLNTAKSIFDILWYGVKKLKTIYYARVVQIDANKNIAEKHIKNIQCIGCAD